MLREVRIERPIERISSDGDTVAGMDDDGDGYFGQCCGKYGDVEVFSENKNDS